MKLGKIEIHFRSILLGLSMGISLFLSLLLAARNQTYGISSSRARALASFDNPVGLWLGGGPLSAMLVSKYTGTSAQRGLSINEESGEAKIIRTGSVALESPDPVSALRRVTQALAPLGASLIGSAQTQSEDERFEIEANVIVPSGRFEEAMRLIRESGTYVISEHTDSRNVAREYVDSEATLRNYQAEEAQYLSIMKNARTVHDTLEVSQHLADVRGRIEKAKADFELLSHQIEMSAISIYINPEEHVGPLRLRPALRLRRAFRDGLASLADYASGVVSVLAYLPAILLWFGTVFVAAALGWKLTRLLWRILFARPKAA